MNFAPQPNNSPENPLNTEVNASKVVKSFFEGIVQYTFSVKLGVPDPALIEYVSDFLVRSLRTEALAMRLVNGSLTDDYQQMSIEAQNRIGDAKISAYQRLGERVLFWSGFYPEAIAEQADGALVTKSSSLMLWMARGKETYAALSQMVPVSLSSGIQLAHPVYADVSKRFEMVAYGLREVRNVIEVDAVDGQNRQLLY